MYQRGNTYGFIDTRTNTKYRLKTLGLEQEFERATSSVYEKEHKTSRATPEREQTAEAKPTPEGANAAGVGLGVGVLLTAGAVLEKGAELTEKLVQEAKKATEHIITGKKPESEEEAKQKAFMEQWQEIEKDRSEKKGRGKAR